MASKPEIKTVGELKKSGYQPVSVKDELRKNLLSKLRKKEALFEGIIGYEDSVIPELETAILSRHNILLLGLSGTSQNPHCPAIDSFAGRMDARAGFYRPERRPPQAFFPAGAGRT